MKYTIPETTFEDQIYSLYKDLNLRETIDNNLENIYIECKNSDYVSISYRSKYLRVLLFGSDFTVSPENFENGIFNAFKSHSFCLKEQSSILHIERIIKEVIVSVTTKISGEQKVQEKRFEYFKSLVNAMNRIIEDKDIPYPGSLFNIALLHRIDEMYVTETQDTIKKTFLYFADNITKNKVNNTVLLVSNYDYPQYNLDNIFLNYLIVLSQFNTEQKKLKNLLWDEFNVNNRNNTYYLKNMINIYKLAKIDLNAIDKEILFEKINVDYLIELRGKLSEKSIIKDELTTFLSLLATEKQKKYMFIQGVLNKELDNKYVLIEKEYFPGLINSIVEEDIESILKEGVFYSSSLKKIILNKQNFMVKTLGIDFNYGLTLTEENEIYYDLILLKPAIIEAFKVYNIKENKKVLKKSISNIKKLKPKERL